MNTTLKKDSGSGSPSSAATIDSVPLISTADLFKDHNTVHIEHRGQCYMLRITRENKLILTK